MLKILVLILFKCRRKRLERHRTLRSCSVVIGTRSVGKMHNAGNRQRIMSMEHWENDTERGKPKCSERTCFSTTFSAVSPT